MQRDSNLQPVKTDGSARPKPVLIARDWLIAVVLLAVIVFLWIGFEIYEALVTTRVPGALRELAEPLSTEIDSEILDELEGRVRLKDRELLEEQRVILSDDEEVQVSSPSGEGESAP